MKKKKKPVKAAPPTGTSKIPLLLGIFSQFYTISIEKSSFLFFPHRKEVCYVK
jgi:hypothetical protein